MEMIINIIGFILIWVASDIGRGPESRVKMFTGNWFIIFILITIGVLLAGYDQLPK